MKLTNVSFKNLQHTDLLNIDCLNVNVLIGPNGSGKSTTLEILRNALDILQKKTVAGHTKNKDSWLNFERAIFVFEGKLDNFKKAFEGILDKCTNELRIEFFLENETFSIDHIMCGDEIVISSSVTVEEIERSKLSILEIGHRIDEIQKKLDSDISSDQVNLLSSEYDRLQMDLLAEETISKNNENIEIAEPGKLPVTFSRSRMDNALTLLKLPSVVWINTLQDMESSIPGLIGFMCLLKSGKSAQNKQYVTEKLKLQRLLQGEVDFFQKEDIKTLTVDGVDYKKLSSGTKVSLAYFGITNLLNPNDIIIWDEPENGLHPTRRIRVLDLIIADGRQFFIATHALEFAPVFSENSLIYRCDSEYEEDAEHPKLSIKNIKTRKEGFLLLEAMGVQPARTLFTASVVIWVEGPTELVFYRHWLKILLQKQGIEEGFHYTIMHYGGSLISYLAVDDQKHIKHAFDALSMCRNLIVIVDSDLKEEVVGDVKDHLKIGADKIRLAIDNINNEREGSAMFCVTGGREIENYLPGYVLLEAASKCWKGYKRYEDIINSTEFEFGRYDNFEEALSNHFIKLGITYESDKGEPNDKKAAGMSLWGAQNKVEMMRAALSIENLDYKNFCWDFAVQLDRIVDFIKKANNHHDS